VDAHAPSLLRLLRYLVRVGVLAEAEGDLSAAAHPAGRAAALRSPRLAAVVGHSLRLALDVASLW
jgi:hypothetical protein